MEKGGAAKNTSQNKGKRYAPKPQRSQKENKYSESIHCGKETIKISKALEGDVSEYEIKNTDWRGNQEIGWFISDFVLTIGMVGTVSGFLLMLTGAFAGVDLNDEVAMQNVLEKMSKGMSTALYTTLFGLISGGLLKIQYFSLGRATDNLIGPIDKKS